MRKKIIKVISVILGILCSISVVLTVLLYCFGGRTINVLDVVPIESVTGIDIPASLKDGCYIREGYGYSEIGYVNSVIMCEPGQESLHVSDIRIIDVYGSGCTITFWCDDNRYKNEGYPLSNLIYNEDKVRKADDGIKSSYVDAQRITVREARSYSHFGLWPYVLWIFDIIGVVILIYTIGCKDKNIRSEQK